MHKNFIVALAIVAVTGAGLFAGSVSAQTNDFETQVQKLRTLITELTAYLETLRAARAKAPLVIGSAMPSKHRICYVLARNLGFGAEGDDVRSLQEFLYENKMLTVAPTGYFGKLTEDAVKRWQGYEGLSVAGSFGPLSRARLQIWCGGNQNQNQERFSATPREGSAPLTVTFDTWFSGFRVPSVYYTIDFGDGTEARAADCPAPADACTGPGQNKHTYSSNGTYTATLKKIVDPCPDDGDPTTPRCLAAIQSEVVGKVLIFVGTQACTKEYKPVCGAKPIVCITTPCNPIPTSYGNRCAMNADGASFLYEGECRAAPPSEDPQCKTWYDGCNSCARNNPGDAAMCTLRYCAIPGQAYCTAYFDDDNRAPTISSFSGPTTIKEDITGTWTVKASDRDGDALTYEVRWGDENTNASNYATGASTREFTQTTSFTHVYATPGTYTISVTVTDEDDEDATTTMTVQVTSTAPVACTEIYTPVCGRPTTCASTCTAGQDCVAMCRYVDTATTYTNRCKLDAASAQYLHEGVCSATSGY